MLSHFLYEKHHGVSEHIGYLACRGKGGDVKGENMNRKVQKKEKNQGWKQRRLNSYGAVYKVSYFTGRGGGGVDVRTKGIVGKWPICLQGDGRSYLRGWTYVECGLESIRAEDFDMQYMTVCRMVHTQVNFSVLLHRFDIR